MNFAAFEHAIQSPPLKRVARLWNETRKGRLMPDWSDIRPSHLGTLLPIIWSYRYDREADAFIGRIAGDQIEHVLGTTLRGKPMADLYSADEFPRMRDRFRRVITEPALLVQEGMVFRWANSFGRGERIVMPLAKDGRTGDGIFGATVYETFGAGKIPSCPDKDLWFPVHARHAGARHEAAAATGLGA